MEMESGALVVSLSANGVWAQRRDPGAELLHGYAPMVAARRDTERVTLPGVRPLQRGVRRHRASGSRAILLQEVLSIPLLVGPEAEASGIFAPTK